jgi:hypothetical protein
MACGTGAFGNSQAEMVNVRIDLAQPEETISQPFRETAGASA